MSPLVVRLPLMEMPALPLLITLMALVEVEPVEVFCSILPPLLPSLPLPLPQVEPGELGTELVTVVAVV